MDGKEIVEVMKQLDELERIRKLKRLSIDTFVFPRDNLEVKMLLIDVEELTERIKDLHRKLAEGL